MQIPYETRCRPAQKIHFYASHQRTCYCGASVVPDRNNKELYGPNCFLFAETPTRKRTKGAPATLEASTDEVEPEQEASYVEEWGVQKDRSLLEHLGLRGEALEKALAKLPEDTDASEEEDEEEEE